MAKWAGLAELEMKLVFGLWHAFGNFNIFELNPLHPKQPSANKILV
jgi:hypothetical protein